MKFIFSILLGLLSFALTAQDYSKNTCLDLGILEQARSSIINLLESRRQDFGRNEDQINILHIKEYFQKTKLNIYKNATAYFGDKVLDCTEIISWSIIEIYLSHEPMQYIYIVLELSGGKFFIVSYDLILNQGMLLGEAKKDYFSMMIDFLFPNIKSKVGENYILYLKMSNEKLLEVDIATDVNLWTINQIALLEAVLFD